MKWILIFLTAALLAGCATSSKSPEVASAPPIPAGQVPPVVLREIPKRIQELQPGMSEAEVFQALGLYDIALSGDSVGPLERNVRMYELCPGYGLNLIFDARQRPAKLVAFRLEGQGWEKLRS